MAGHEKHVDRAERRVVEALRRLGADLREARLNHDLSQSDTAAAAGMSGSAWSRIERGEAYGVPVTVLARALAVVGLELGLRAFPAGRVMRDASHVRLLERLRARLGPGVRWRTEVPLPTPGDGRAWDAMIGIGRVRVGVEAETRARDSQELERRLALKRRDGGVDHVILLLADTRSNRLFVRGMGEGFRSAFPVPGRTVLARLAAGEDPGGSGIVVL